MQQENIRHQINIEINYKQTDERYQKNKIKEKESDEKNRSVILTEKIIIEDKEIMKLQNSSKEIEKMNRKDQDGLE